MGLHYEHDLPSEANNSISSSDIFVIVPAFNESSTITKVLADLTASLYNVIVVDDGSSDDTALKVLQFPVTLLRHICNLGQGAALQTGISYVVGLPQARFIVTFDADGQHNVNDIPNLIEPLKADTHDVVLGSRFLRKGDAQNIKFLKRLTLVLALAFTKLSTGLNITDTHNGFRAFTHEAAAKISLTQNGMAHSSEILNQIASRKFRYCEVPVTIVYTSYSIKKGQSVLNSINILWEIVGRRLK